MWTSDVPTEVQDVFREFRTCEFSTFAKDGTPITWPTAPFLLESGRFLITSSIGISQKVLNVRRNPKVSLLFSDPTGSALDNPPAVLVQGDAEAPDEIVTTTVGYEEQFPTIFRRQPASAFYSSNPLTRYLFDWYYMRLFVYVTPRRVIWRERGDFTCQPQELEVQNMD
jgi:pyridoxamine 5'-phosphate oxidase-like protein